MRTFSKSPSSSESESRICARFDLPLLAARACLAGVGTLLGFSAGRFWGAAAAAPFDLAAAGFTCVHNMVAAPQYFSTKTKHKNESLHCKGALAPTSSFLASFSSALSPGPGTWDVDHRDTKLR